MDTKQIAMEAIAEGMHILSILASDSNKQRWLSSSVPRGDLDRLARKLGFNDAVEVAASIDADHEAESEAWSGVFDVEEW